MNEVRPTTSRSPHAPIHSLAPISCTIAHADLHSLDRQEQFIQIISQLTQSYALAGDFVLPQPPEKIRLAAQERRLVIAVDAQSGEFVGAAKWVPLLVESGTVSIAEIGSLVRAPGMRGYGLPSPVAQCVRAIVHEFNLRGGVALATARSDKSRSCLQQGGMVEGRWEHLSALAALTCDPGCAPSPSGQSAWKSCGTDISCDARIGAVVGRSDACSLFVSHPERALEINHRLESEIARNHGCFSAIKLRAALGLTLG